MLQKPTFLLALFLLLSCSAQAQTISQKKFASRALLGIHYGYYRSWEESWNNRYEIAKFLGPRAGISINKWLYAGIQGRIIKARNFETPWQNFYMAGLWGRGYLKHPVSSNKSQRLGVFIETGIMTGNYYVDTRDFTEYYIRRSNQWYIPIIIGGELRLVENLTVELCLQSYYDSSRNWGRSVAGYASLGLNWYFGKT